MIDDVNEINELDLLKDRARVMGITFSNNIGIESLKKKIEDKMNGTEDEPVNKTNEVNPLVQSAEVAPAPKLTLREQVIADAMKLVRVRISNMDPKKKDLHGEIFTVANEYIGNVKRFVPYGEQTDEGWHLPQCIYDQLESRRFLLIRTVKDRRTGTPRVEQTWQKEFALQVLPQLTKEELAKLAAAQAAAAGA